MCIGVTMGDASGVGPEIALRTFKQGKMPESAVVIGDLAILEHCNSTLELNVRLQPVEQLNDRTEGTLSVCDMGILGRDDLRIGEISEASGEAALEYVDFAARRALEGELRAIVTLPMNKAATRLTVPDFTGHTDFIADLCGTSRYAMTLALPELLITHVTGHVALREAIEGLNADIIYDTIKLAHEAVVRLDLPERIAVMGLNPHAGEGGAFGREEIDHIAPAAQRARGEGMDAAGPLPPDTVFGPALDGEYGGVVCMYHDQGHIPVKMLGLHKAVAVTLGLPIVRTSVDHGTAFDIAWQGVAEIGSFVNACRLAERLTEDWAT